MFSTTNYIVIYTIVAILALAQNLFFEKMSISPVSRKENLLRSIGVVRSESKWIFILKNIGIVLLIILLVYFCVTRPANSWDYMQYERMYDSGIGSIEESYFMIAALTPSFVILLAVYAIFSVTIHIVAIKWISLGFWVSIFVYLSKTFVLHDLYQIREGACAALFLLSIPFLVKKRAIFFLIIIVGSFLHSSSLLLLPFGFMSSKKINKPLYIFFIIISFILVSLDMNVKPLVSFIAHLPILDRYSDKLGQSFYIQGDLGITNFVTVFFAILLVYSVEKFQGVYKYGIIVVKVFAMYVISRPLLWGIPLGGRVVELYSVIEIFAIPLFVFIYSWQKHPILFCLPFAYYIYYFFTRISPLLYSL